MTEKIAAIVTKCGSGHIGKFYMSEESIQMH